MNASAGLKQAYKSSRDIRSLANLGETAMTSRVLNLAQIYITSGRDEDYARKPFFRDSRLNKAILIKHTLRANEADMFGRQRRTATKIMLPFDPVDLRLGASSIFVGQIGFENFCRSYFGTSDINTDDDIRILRLLDSIPSLDPFLVRELLSRNGYKPAACYLKISANDIQRMIGFANSEIERLVHMAFGSTISGAAVKLTTKILSDELDRELEPLKLTLRMADDVFSDGIFSWRGFLYFKWRYLTLQGEMNEVIEGIAKYQTRGKPDQNIGEYLNEARPRLVRRIVSTISAIGRTLAVYDTAYGALIDRGDPAPFRQFLIDGPGLFYELGESVAILDHIGSFWRYRMADPMTRLGLEPSDYADLILDFEESLATQSAGGQ